jgi:hypothetical protein
MDPPIFDRVVVDRVEPREQLPGGQAFEVLAANGGDGLPQVTSLRVVATDGLLAAIQEPPEVWIAQAIERGATSLPNDGAKLIALRAKDIVFDSRFVLD